MSNVPPFPWTDLATKADLELTSRELRSEMREMRGELLEKISSQSWKIVTANIASSAAVAAAVVAAIRL